MNEGRLRQATGSFRAYRSRDIVSETMWIAKGELFIIVGEEVAWQKILTKTGMRYIWFPEFEKSQDV